MSDTEDEIARFKARLQALESAAPLEVPGSPARRPAPKTGGKSGFLIVVAVALLGGVAYCALLPSSKGSAALSAQPETTCNKSASQLRVGLALSSGVVSRTEFGDGGMIIILSRQGGRLDYPELENIAAAYDCGVAGPDGYLTKIMLRRSLHGEDVAMFSSTDLLHLRERGLPR